MTTNKATRSATIFLFFFLGNNHAKTTNTPQQATWTFMVYMAAANDLEIFAPRNMRQMQQVGSNERINIVAQHNTHEHNKHSSKTYFIEKGNKRLIKENPHACDSGESKTLTDFCRDTIAAYPADHYALILWNHGTGPIEPVMRSHLSSLDLFSLSYSHDLFDHKSISFSPFPHYKTSRTQQIYKGICFNDISGNFFTEQQLCNTLKTVCTTSLKGKKFDIIGFDACLMSMIEIATAIQPYATHMVASQDVERGTGWDYYYALYPFMTTTITPAHLGAHLVHAYAKAYKKTSDYTQTCLNLENIHLLTENVSRVSTLLQNLLKNQEDKKARLAVKLSRNKHLCTHFDEPEFIDLYHFYMNVSLNIEQITCEPQNPLNQTIQELRVELTRGKQLIKSSVLENKAGSTYPNAHGISIYFPEHTIHSSYRRCAFTEHSSWLPFLKTYLSAARK